MLLAASISVVGRSSCGLVDESWQQGSFGNALE
jgi:hypothetical protein